MMATLNGSDHAIGRDAEMAQLADAPTSAFVENNFDMNADEGFGVDDFSLEASNMEFANDVDIDEPVGLLDDLQELSADAELADTYHSAADLDIGYEEDQATSNTLANDEPNIAAGVEISYDVDNDVDRPTVDDDDAPPATPSHQVNHRTNNIDIDDEIGYESDDFGASGDDDVAGGKYSEIEQLGMQEVDHQDREREPSALPGADATNISHPRQDDSGSGQLGSYQVDCAEHNNGEGSNLNHDLDQDLDRDLDYDNTEREDPDDLLGITVMWRREQYSLIGKDGDEADTFFFAGDTEMDCDLSEFLAKLRDVITDEISQTDCLSVRISQLSLTFGEKSGDQFLSRTFREIVDCYNRLTMNDGIQSSPLVLSLTSVPDCEARFQELLAGADQGKGLSEMVDFASDEDPEDIRRDYDPELGDPAEDAGDMVGLVRGGKEQTLGENGTGTAQSTNVVSQQLEEIPSSHEASFADPQQLRNAHESAAREDDDDEITYDELDEPGTNSDEDTSTPADVAELSTIRVERDDEDTTITLDPFDDGCPGEIDASAENEEAHAASSKSPDIDQHDEVGNTEEIDFGPTYGNTLALLSSNPAHPQHSPGGRMQGKPQKDRDEIDWRSDCGSLDDQDILDHGQSLRLNLPSKRAASPTGKRPSKKAKSDAACMEKYDKRFPLGPNIARSFPTEVTSVSSRNNGENEPLCDESVPLTTSAHFTWESSLAGGSEPDPEESSFLGEPEGSVNLDDLGDFPPATGVAAETCPGPWVERMDQRNETNSDSEMDHDSTSSESSLYPRAPGHLENFLARFPSSLTHSRTQSNTSAALSHSADNPLPDHADPPSCVGDSLGSDPLDRSTYLAEPYGVGPVGDESGDVLAEFDEIGATHEPDDKVTTNGTTHPTETAPVQEGPDVVSGEPVHDSFEDENELEVDFDEQLETESRLVAASSSLLQGTAAPDGAGLDEINWEDGEEEVTIPNIHMLEEAVATPISLSGKRERQTDQTESFVEESDHKRRRT